MEKMNKLSDIGNSKFLGEYFSTMSLYIFNLYLVIRLFYIDSAHDYITQDSLLFISLILCTTTYISISGKKGEKIHPNFEYMAQRESRELENENIILKMKIYIIVIAAALLYIGMVELAYIGLTYIPKTFTTLTAVLFFIFTIEQLIEYAKSS